MRILTKDQSRNIDNISIEKYKISQNSLMIAAANSIVSHIENYSASINKKPKLLFICGKGNNGADSICAANILYEKKYNLHLHFLIDKDKISGQSKLYYQKYINLSSHISFGSKLKIFYGYDLLIDGILGTGFRGVLGKELIDWIEWINESSMHVISVDIPSGLNSDNGLAFPTAIKAKDTITFGYSKLGLHLANGKDYCGNIFVKDIGFPKPVLDEIDDIECKLFNDKEIDHILTKVPTNTYKQDRGKVLIIAGSIGMTGAAVLSTYGALRSGSGVTITVCPSSLNNIYEKYILEGMTFPCEDNGKGYLGIRNYDAIMEKVEWADSLVIGPGLGMNKDTIKLISKLINSINKPIVLDADGLSCFSKLNGSLDNIIITPHLGEFSRMIKMETSIIINDFIDVIKNFINQFNCVALIKHVPACIAHDNRLSLNSSGNSGLSTAGSGDVLSGMIASFIAQKINNYDACRLASFFHGKAADRLLNEKGYRGIIASDLPLEISRVIKEYEN